MNQKEIFYAIGGISDALITEADDSVKKVRHIRILRIAGLAAALIVLLGMTVFATSILFGGSRSIHSSSIPDYYSVPSRQTLEQDIGIQLNVINAFSNGYLFKSGHITHNRDYDENGNVFEQYKGLKCKYEHDGNRVSFYVDAAIAGNQMEHIETAEIYKGCELKYYAYTNKLVPGNYELTEQDKKDKESGKYVFSYGSDEIEIIEVQGVGWEHGELNCSFVVIDTNITKDELIQMVKEIIDYQK